MFSPAEEVCSTSGRAYQVVDARALGYWSQVQGSSRRGRLCNLHQTASRLHQNSRRDLSRVMRLAAPKVDKYPELEKMMEEKDTKGTETPVKIVFRAVNTFDLWIWFELYRPPTKDDKDLLETVLESWFLIGRLGGFNGMNMQVSQNASGQASFYKYETDDTESASQALFMNYSEVETQGKWCRFWLNMGTADEVALDILINAISVFSRENIGIKQLIIGGANPDWPVISREEQALEELKDPSMAADSIKVN